jgi:hypothetical protein
LNEKDRNENSVKENGERENIEEVLPGFKIHPLEDGYRPVFAFTLVKTVDEAGTFSWAYRTSEPPNREELLGALQIHVDLLRRELLAEWEEE